MMRRALAIAAAVVALCGAAGAAEPGRGFPFRGASAHCISAGHTTDNQARAARGDYRWFVKSLAHFNGRDDGCRAERMTRYGQAQVWRVRLACPGGTTYEHWMLNFDGSITANRDGSKTTFRPCENGLAR